LAPLQVVIVPIYKKEEELGAISEAVEKIMEALKKRGISVKYDDSDKQRPGFKFAEYELKGVPVRVAVGPRDIEKGPVEVARRDTREKTTIPMETTADTVAGLLDEIQQNIFRKALEFRDANTRQADNFDQFKEILEEKGGFILAHWDGSPETEQRIKEETKATIRCIPLNNPKENGKCILTGKPSEQRVVFAKAY